MVERKDRRPNERLYPAKILAGWVTVAVLAGFAYVAVDRSLNHRFLPVIVVVLAVLVVGLVVSMRRRRGGRR